MRNTQPFSKRPTTLATGRRQTVCPPDADASRTRNIAGRVERAPELQDSSSAELAQSAVRLSGTTSNNYWQFADGDTESVPMRLDLRERIRVQSKLPSLPRGWHREMALRPAPGSYFSGDFVVGARTNSGRWLEVVLTDLSGKGMEAGSRALLLSGAFDGLLGSLPPREFLPAANNYLLRQDWDEAFATSIYLALDLDSGDYELFSAGHLPGLQLSTEHGLWQEKFADGPVLGLFDGAHFDPVQGSLRPGDVLMLFTDGLIEASVRDLTDGIDRLVGEADHYMTAGFRGAAWHLIGAAAEYATDDRALLLIGRDGE
ncbi:PP2C family protein-serine/threonine phosphatase [Streptomyces sp. NPDC021218]|uniref:PP2C family protein-serine/threonine phosphatase n=1 Tax=Streptomyces sp. NPDC021218 TaxID=3365119 RepID=UPI0037A91F38